MFDSIKNFLTFTHRNVFVFAITDFPGRDQDHGVDDIVGPDLALELGVFIVQEKGERDNRILVVDTDNQVSTEQILDVFSRHDVTAHLIHTKE